MKIPFSCHADSCHNCSFHLAFRSKKQKFGQAEYKKKVRRALLSCGPSIDWRLPTLPLGIAVPSAQMGLTSLFGMDRGGSPSLLPPLYNPGKRLIK